MQKAKITDVYSQDIMQDNQSIDLFLFHSAHTAQLLLLLFTLRYMRRLQKPLKQKLYLPRQIQIMKNMLIFSKISPLIFNTIIPVSFLLAETFQ